MEKIREVAMKFREAIERTDKSLLPVQLQEFPYGASDATLLLARYLCENGFGPFEHIVGERNKCQDTLHYHAWIEKDGLIIDITADQYGEIPDKVIVSNDSEWHQTFFTESQGVADIEKYIGYNTKRTLLGAYNNILENLDS
jgi:hypothetical protein